MTNKEYGEKDITVLEGLEAVRVRPGMYIGGVNLRALTHLPFEAIDNSIDEYAAGFGKEIKVTLHKDGSISIEDFGRGIPVGIKEEYGISTVELLLTNLHSGGKFGQGGYNKSGGLHGVGITVINALSKWVNVTVWRDGHEHTLKMKNQEATAPLKKGKKSKRTGTLIHFLPDDTIFETVEFDFDLIATRMKELSFLNAGLSMTIIDEREGKEDNITYLHKGGLEEYIELLNQSVDPVHKKPIVISTTDAESGVDIDCAMQFAEHFEDRTFSYANNIRTADGGTHEQGLKTALTRAINEMGRKQKVLKDNDKNLQGDDVREGLTAVISVKLSEPKFEGQTKSKLGNSEIQGIVITNVYEHLCIYFEKNKSVLTSIIRRAKDIAKQKEAMRQRKQVTKKKTTMEISGLSSKFAACTTKKPSEAELYIVEGDSAGGSAKQGRDRYFQAILPLRGKVVNAEKETMAKVLSNAEIGTMIHAIGAGIGKDMDADQSNFDKVIIMTDADIDGAHIQVLLLTFFYRYMKPLVEAGKVYIALPPLYKITHGKNTAYVYNDEERDEYVKGVRGKVDIVRYKGLGEMDAEHLWETTMNPETRTLIRVTANDAMRSHQVISDLMGKHVPPRREFLTKNADKAEIDV